jgi:hypothetical protein
VLPAPFVNTTNIAAGRTIVRIAFGESVGGQTFYRAAVTMNVASAKGLAESLLKAADQVETRKDRAGAEAKDGD